MKDTFQPTDAPTSAAPTNPAVDTSTQAPIALPVGGGALRSMGETFQANPVTGTASFSVPVKVSGGRNGMAPTLTLAYNSGQGNGVFGLGWDAGIPAITRRTRKGLPRYDDAQESDTFILSGAEDLVPYLEETNGQWQRVTRTEAGYTITRYRPRTEGLFARIERWQATDTGISHWRITTKDNMTSVYGETAGGRIADPAAPAHVFQWLLEKTYDDKGNIILYTYQAEDRAHLPAALHEAHRQDTTPANRYPKRIYYGNTLPFTPDHATFFDDTHWLFEVVFDYGDQGDADTPAYAATQPWDYRHDPFSTYTAGFEQRTYRLCRRILMYHHIDALSAAPYLTCATELTYATQGTYSLLQQVQHRYYQAGETPAPYPPVAFTYTEAQVDPTVYTADDALARTLPDGVDGVRRQWIDLYGEGLPGILYDDTQAWWYQRNQGDARYYTYDPTATATAPTLLMQAHQTVSPRPAARPDTPPRLADLNGDGVPELQLTTPAQAGYYTQDPRHGWQHFYPYTDTPALDWDDPNLRMIDLTGDGFADLLLTETQCFTWYAATVTDGQHTGYTEAHTVARALDDTQGPTIVFEDAEAVIYLADMSGDGLTDLVRVRNGAISYWPNLGYGRFGPQVRMDDAPTLDHPDLFNRQRLHLADVDGTGTADVVYFADDAVTYWPNLSGNAWGTPTRLPHRFPIDSLSTCQVMDLFGRGTACLVCTTMLPGQTTPTLRYLDLMQTKPFLLQQVDNHLGALTRIQYAPSTQFYLQDERAGTPWVTRLPFPVQVIERTEVYDQITGQRRTTRYAYHHGYYDGLEREFRGFGRVDQWDTEAFDILQDDTLFAGDNANEQAQDYVAPALTKTWFHLGHLTDREDILNTYRHEYYAGDARAYDVPEVTLEAGVDSASLREALRALRGALLRQEVYAEDDSAAAAHPYLVREAGYTIRPVQPRGENDYAVFLTYGREELTTHYERIPDDPHLTHSLTLAVDAYGHPLQTVALAYPRRMSAYAEQQTLHATLSETTYIHYPAAATFYRLGLPHTQRSYELTGLPLPAGTVYTAAEINTFLAGATEIAYDATPTAGEAEKRLLSATYGTYYSADLTTELPAGEAAYHALPYRQYALAFTPGLISSVYNTRVNATLLTSAEAGYHSDADGYWQPSARQVYDAARFYLPVQTIDPFGTTATMTYDAYALLPTATEDALQNRTQADNDYRVLKPYQVTDPNQNRSTVAFDVRGLVIATAVMGKAGSNDGDTLADPTTRMAYNLFAWMDHGSPNYVHTYAREQHGAANPRFQETYVYTGGLGQEVLTKIQAEPGLAFTRDEDGHLIVDANGLPLLAHTDTRWVGNGRTVYNNKGNAVRQYEPYFSNTPDYEAEAELRQYGVTSEMFYDPIGRVVKSQYPDGTLARTTFTPWQQQTADRQDTVLDSTWYTDRHSPDPTGAEPTDADERAAWLAAQHANTPQTTHLDTLGRTFLTIDDNGTLGTYETRQAYDIKGLVTTVTDAKGRTLSTFRYNLLDERIYEDQLDSGTRRMLSHVLNQPIRMWDNRDQVFRNVYDVLQRPVENYVTQGTAAEKLITYTRYGENLATPETGNFRGQAYQVYDSAGRLQSTAFDFKGNLLSSVRQYAVTYQTAPDWITLPAAADPDTAAAPLLEAETFTQQMAYDALNRATAMTLPDASVVTPTYNEANMLEAVAIHLRGATTATPFVTNIDYNARGQREKIVYANGSQTTYTYDDATFRLTRLLTTRNTGADILQDLRYTYDAVGNITAQQDLAQQTVFFHNTQVDPHGKYTYDALYRLVQAEGRELIGLNTAPGPSDLTINALPDNTEAVRRYTQQYAYDELGNLLMMIHQATGGHWTRYYHYDFAQNNYLLSTSPDGTAPTTAQYTYDAHGNTTAMPHLASVGWDYADRLHTADLGGGGTAYYVYDAAGERVRKVIARNGGLTEERRYLGGWEIFRQTQSGTLQLARETLHVMDDAQRIAQVDTLTVENGTALTTPTQTIRYQLSDHLGTATLELDDSAALISYEAYHPFGTTAYRSGRNSAETSLKRYRYVGKERDEESGLYYYGARYYAPWLARFVSVDPLQEKYPFYTPYQYAGNNPSSFTDLDGRETQDNDTTHVEKNEPQSYKSFIDPPITSPLLTPRLMPGPQNMPLSPPTTVRPPTGPGLGPVVLIPILYELNKYLADASVLEEDEQYEFTYNEYVKLVTLESGYITGSPGDLHHRVNYLIDDYKYNFDSFTPYRALVGKYEEKKITKEVFLEEGRKLLEKQKEDDGKRYTVYVTARDFKQQQSQSWFSVFDVDQPLFYTGLTVNEAERYGAQEIQRKYFEPVAEDVTKDVARGVEQLLIELNNGGKPYPYRSETLDNFLNSTSPFRLQYYTRKLAGLLYLEANIPDWRTAYLRPPDVMKSEILK